MKKKIDLSPVNLINPGIGSPFERRVWKACAAIPKGEVRTYGWVARKIGSPKAVRAVGNALGKNPYAPRIPCHRVVCSDGSLGRYSGPGGTKQKRRLLLEEGAFKNGNPA